MTTATAPAPKLTFIPDILEEHLEELAFLWGQRTNALRSSDYTMREIRLLEERIEAHADGLLVVGDRLVPFVEEALAGDDPNTLFAATFALLRLNTDASLQRVLRALESAAEPRLEGIRAALCHGPIDRLVHHLQSILVSAPAPSASTAAEALAFHGALNPTAARIHDFLTDHIPTARQTGWRIAAYLGLQLDARTYAAAMRDENPAVRAAALTTAAWNGEQAVLAIARQAAATPTPDHLDALRFLAILGGPDDLQRMASIGMADALGASRFDLVASYGHPALVDLLLVEMSRAEKDPEAGAAAGAAFARVTGKNVESDHRAKVPPGGGPPPDDFDAEFQEEVTLPDYPAAYRHWQEVKPRLGQAGRLAKGFDVAGGLTAETFAALDMQSRWEACLRGRFQGVWPGSPLDLERYPQAR
jgi:uncharacterized protein (TIGR02270 family)